MELAKCDVLCSNCHDLEHTAMSYEWYEKERVNKRVPKE